ncbi:MAG TPA: non-canonical purine NTP pyrophosphatase, partial [Bryobacteraceae bacterium]|nr:non-canonical purine NTP pyrophosphatase [Bryobacteraceae bacterium]
ILTAARGSNGFGYDPLFFYPPLERSFGEIDADEKFAVSHRGQALRCLFEWVSRSPEKPALRSVG